MAKLNIGIAVRDDIAAQMHATYLGQEDWRRDHLGASMLGHKCDRFLWLGFRWALNPQHSGRLLRLFDTGHREEARIYRDLRKAGMTVEAGKTLRKLRWGHLGGHGDGRVTGVPGAESTVHLLECKTHSAKSFAWLRKNGVKIAKPEHYIQMQVYMHGYDLDRALYVAVGKNDDDLHVERVTYDCATAEAALARGQSIVDASEPPARMDPESPPCKLVAKDGTEYPCQFWELCHGKARPERNCRTCVYSTPLTLGDDDAPVWACGKLAKPCNRLLQRRGCKLHLTIPPIVNAQTDICEEAKQVTYTFADGSSFTEDIR